jgi:hypothetical protein
VTLFGANVTDFHGHETLFRGHETLRETLGVDNGSIDPVEVLL